MVENINRPTDIAYMMTEEKLFWFNEMNELFFTKTGRLSGSNFNNKTRLMTLQQTARGLTVDWVERSLYYVQNNTIFKLNLNHVFEGKGRAEVVLTSTNTIINMEISPFTK